ncbi:unnamed protein product [Prorocentrum cordatum]|uniref:Uncharacterized protein n=1 Tax=Prorocentrum cordatum TaxID=2364126 RepID=A0ABN9T4W9_9DINO|nr:unnamed protein product [Polarella glacialis]
MASPTVAGVGDPHLVNTYGQKFDLFQAGYYTLINIPRWARQRANFVRARAGRAGAGCADLHFTEINISGTWAHGHMAADFRWVAEAVRLVKSRWMKFDNKFRVKIAHGHRPERDVFEHLRGGVGQDKGSGGRPPRGGRPHGVHHLGQRVQEADDSVSRAPLQGS